MSQTKNKKNVFKLAKFVLICVVFGLSVPASNKVEADTMQSAHFKIQADIMSVGGGRSSSAAFIIQDTIGDLAIGEDLSSASYLGCAGYQCFVQKGYIQLSLNAGTSMPGVPGATVNLGNLTPAAVKGSNHTTVNSIFLLAGSNGDSTYITVRSLNSGLYSPSTADIINSATATLVANTPGYGICVASTTNFTSVSPYNGTCNTTSGHDVGIVDSNWRNILTKNGQLASGSAEILVKTAIDFYVDAATDYADNLVFVITSTY